MTNRANRRALAPKHTRYDAAGQISGHTTKEPRSVRRQRTARRNFLAKASRRANW